MWGCCLSEVLEICTYCTFYFHTDLLSRSLEREWLRLLECLLRLVTLLPDELEEEEDEDERRLCFFLRRLRLSSSLSDERRPMSAQCLGRNRKEEKKKKI